MKNESRIETKYRYFGPMILSMENWLNRMAHLGYRLEDTGKLSWRFRRCEKEKYQYKVEYVAHLSLKENQDEQQLFRDMGYRVWTKNMNLDWSAGKARLRPGAEGAGIATKPGTIDKEILILERENTGESFQIHTVAADRAEYLRPMFRAWCVMSVLMLALSVFKFYTAGTEAAMPLFIITVFCAVGAGQYLSNIRALKKDPRE